jgi:hypothetical protein
MAATCTAADTQYVGLDGTCQSYCENARWPIVASDEDSLSCRNTHVQLAAASTNSADRTMHCGHAGPTGGNICGSWCENYCNLVLQNCTGANGAGLGFTDHASCVAACGALDAGGAINAPSGDTVQCRIYHAGAAATMPVPHCGHAQLVSSATVGGTTADGPCN